MFSLLGLTETTFGFLRDNIFENSFTWDFVEVAVTAKNRRSWIKDRKTANSLKSVRNSLPQEKIKIKTLFTKFQQGTRQNVQN